MTKKTQLPLNKVLTAIDMCDQTMYASLTDEEKLAFEPWVIMRYASSSTKWSEYYLCMVNDLLNVDFSITSKHPELFWRLAVMCGTGTTSYHPWIAPMKRKKDNKLHEKLLELNLMWGAREVSTFLMVNTYDEIEEYLLDYGIEIKEVKKLLSCL